MERRRALHTALRLAAGHGTGLFAAGSAGRKGERTSRRPNPRDRRAPRRRAPPTRRCSASCRTSAIPAGLGSTSSAELGPPWGRPRPVTHVDRGTLSASTSGNVSQSTVMSVLTRFPKPRVAGSIPAEGTRSTCGNALPGEIEEGVVAVTLPSARQSSSSWSSSSRPSFATCDVTNVS
jgi:hypothetical protein